MEEAVLAKLKEVAGESFADEWVEQLDAVIDPAIEASTAKATDGLRSKIVAQTNAAKEAANKASQLEEQLADVGQTDEALAKAQALVAEHEAKAADLAAQLRSRDIRDAAVKALSGSDLPADRQSAALKLLSLDGVNLDEAGQVVGLEASVEALKAEHAFLWEAGQTQAQGNGGPAAGSEPPAGKPKPKSREEMDLEYGRQAALAARSRRAGKIRPQR